MRVTIKKLGEPDRVEEEVRRVYAISDGVLLTFSSGHQEFVNPDIFTLDVEDDAASTTLAERVDTVTA